jgi:hypothetical protein
MFAMQRIILCVITIFLFVWLPGLPVSDNGDPGTEIEDLPSISLASTGALPTNSGTPEAQAPAILSPLAGQALQGSVPIVVRTGVGDLVACELSFAYFNNPTGVWFLLFQGNQPVTDGVLAQWDTSTITDGVYTLRLTVFRADGNQQTVTVPGVRVRNYTPIETDTPDPFVLTETKLSSQESVTPPFTSTIIPPTATPLPPNPAELNRKDVIGGVEKGVLTVFGLFALGLLYLSIRSYFRNRSNT